MDEDTPLYIGLLVNLKSKLVICNDMGSDPEEIRRDAQERFPEYPLCIMDMQRDPDENKETVFAWMTEHGVPQDRQQPILESLMEGLLTRMEGLMDLDLPELEFGRFQMRTTSDREEIEEIAGEEAIPVSMDNTLFLIVPCSIPNELIPMVNRILLTPALDEEQVSKKMLQAVGAVLGMAMTIARLRVLEESEGHKVLGLGTPRMSVFDEEQMKHIRFRMSGIKPHIYGEGK